MVDRPAEQRSPFPGMDPFIECCGLWEDFHDTLVTEIKRTLATVVPDRYTVCAGERSHIVLASSDEGSEERLRTRPEVAVLPERSGAAPAGESADRAESSVVATDDAPVSMRALVTSEQRESFIEIRGPSPEKRLVTTVEVLSPSNKRPESPGWIQYLRKRQAHLAGHANLVEIDLLREEVGCPWRTTGRRVPTTSSCRARPTRRSVRSGPPGSGERCRRSRCRSSRPTWMSP